MKMLDSFEKMGIVYEPAVPLDATTVPADHHVYNYVWELIDQYSDKHHLYESFKKHEENFTQNDITYTVIDRLYNDHEVFKEMRIMWNDTLQEHDNDITLGMLNDFIDVIGQKFDDEDWCTLDFKKKFKDAEIYSFFENKKLLDKAYDTKVAPIKMILETSFAEAIRQRYDLDHTEPIFHLPLNSDWHIILNEKKRADSHFLDMTHIFDFPEIIMRLKSLDEKSERRLLATESFEKHLNLLQNPRDNQYYISNGQGLMIQFKENNDKYLYAPLRKKFKQEKRTKEEIRQFELIWSRPEFYKLGHQYCSQICEPESFLVSFNNCCYNAKTKTIYELDYRFPRLPMKTSAKNFIFTKDLTGKGGALEAVFEYCFTPQNREIIFKYLGRALFEQGYTQHQEVLLFLGKGGTGKSTFAKAIGRIFKNVTNMSADKMDDTNRFAFSQLPEADFVIMDEITNAHKNFLEKMKEMSSGGDTLPIELKNQNIFNLPGEYVPMMIAIGNEFPEKLNDKFVGAGVARRFCIVFLKHSILEAKVLGVDADGNEIRGMYDQTELYEDNCIEWLIQQVVLHYDPDERTLLSQKEAQDRANMATYPEKWIIEQYCDITRNPSNTNEVSMEKHSPTIYLDDLLFLIHQKLDELMLEKTIKDPNDSKLLKYLGEVFNIEPTNGFHVQTDNDRKGRSYIYGIEWVGESFLNDETQK